MPYLEAGSRICDEGQKVVPRSSIKKAILTLLDQIRDNDLTNLGVPCHRRMSRRFIKLIPATDFMAQKEANTSKERDKAAQDEAARLVQEKQEGERKGKEKAWPNVDSKAQLEKPNKDWETHKR